MNVAIFSSHNFERAYIDSANSGRHSIQHLSVGLSPETAALARGAEAVAIFGNDDAGAASLEALHTVGVRYVALRSAGYNHVDLDTAKKLGLRVAHVPSYSPYSVAEHTIALILALNRKLIRANSRVRDLNFSLDGLVGFDMNGKTAGIVGVGKIGSLVAKILHGFGCNLLGYDPYPNSQVEENYGLEYTDIETLCSRSDIIALLAPLNDATRHIINENTIARMKKGVMLVNTGRGALVKTKAVIDALKTGHIGYLGMDVYEEEKGLFFHDHSDVILQDDQIARLLTFPNVLITSHQAFLTATALENIASSTIAHIDNWAAGRAADDELVPQG